MFGTETPTIPFKRIDSSRSTRVRMRLDSAGTVIVTAPKRTPQWMVNRFINQNTSWISLQQAKVALRPIVPDNETLLFGRKYQVVAAYEPAQPSGCRVEGDRIFVNLLSPKKASETEKTRVMLERFFRATAAHYVIPRVAQWATTMGIDHGSIQLKQQRSRWGSCSSAGRLNFNWRLVHAPPAVIDYVIIHELAHRRHMNHSAKFWSVVQQYDPEYARHRGWLKREGQFYIPDSEES